MRIRRLILSVLLLSGRPSVKADQASEQINLGTSLEDSGHVFEVAISNHASDYKIASVKPSCGCIKKVEFDAEKIYAKDEPITIKLLLDSTGKAGTLKQQVAFQGTSSGVPTVLAVSFVAQITPVLTVLPEKGNTIDYSVGEKKSLRYVVMVNVPEKLEVDFDASKLSGQSQVLGPNKYSVEIVPDTEMGGSFYRDLIMRVGDRQTSYIVKWNVKHPLADVSTLVGGLLLTGEDHLIRFNLAYTEPFEVRKVYWEVPQESLDYVIEEQPGSLKYGVRVSHHANKPGRVSNVLVMETSLDQRFGPVRMQFNAIYYSKPD